jgi:hypothetical protein
MEVLEQQHAGLVVAEQLSKLTTPVYPYSTITCRLVVINRYNTIGEKEQPADEH